MISCERCIWFCESAGPDGLMHCGHPRFEGWLTDLAPKCAGEGFKDATPLDSDFEESE